MKKKKHTLILLAQICKKKFSFLLCQPFLLTHFYYSTKVCFLKGFGIVRGDLKKLNAGIYISW